MRFHKPFYGPKYDANKYETPDIPIMVIFNEREWKTKSDCFRFDPNSLCESKTHYLAERRFWHKAVITAPCSLDIKNTITMSELIDQAMPHHILTFDSSVLSALPAARFIYYANHKKKTFRIYEVNGHTFCVGLHLEQTSIHRQTENQLDFISSALSLNALTGFNRLPYKMQQFFFDYYSHSEAFMYLEQSDLQDFLGTASHFVIAKNLDSLENETSKNKPLNILAFKQVDSMKEISSWLTKLAVLDKTLNINKIYYFIYPRKLFSYHFFEIEPPTTEWYLLAR